MELEAHDIILVDACLMLFNTCGTWMRTHRHVQRCLLWFRLLPRYRKLLLMFCEGCTPGISCICLAYLFLGDFYQHDFLQCMATNRHIFCFMFLKIHISHRTKDLLETHSPVGLEFNCLVLISNQLN